MVVMLAGSLFTSSLRKQGPITTGVRGAKGLYQRAKMTRHGVWVPARAEPVIGRAFRATRWLGRDDGKIKPC